MSIKKLLSTALSTAVLFGMAALPITASASETIFPSDGTTISEWQYEGSELDEIEIADGVTSIGEGAFCGSSITSVYIPASVEYIGDEAFSDCARLESVTFDEKCTGITFGSLVFVNDTKLQTVTCPTAIKDRVNEALLSSELQIAANESDVPENSCGANTTWTVSDGTLTISGTGTMYNYDPYKAPWHNESATGITHIVIGDGVTAIGDNAFYDLVYATNITIAGSVQNIGKGAFGLCTRVTNITLGSGVQTIGSEAFKECGAAVTVDSVNINMPASVTSIASDAFSGCSKAVVSYSGSDKDVAQALDTSGVKSVEAAVPSAVITPTYVDSATGDVPSEGTAEKPAFAADLNDGGATGFVTEFDNSKNITTTNISSITWTVTSKGVTKSFTSDAHMQLAAKADAYITFIVKNLYDPDATVVTTIN